MSAEGLSAEGLTKPEILVQTDQTDWPTPPPSPDAARQINDRFDSLPGQISADDLVAARCRRSLWAKQSTTSLIDRIDNHSSADAFDNTLQTLGSLRTLIDKTQADRLIKHQSHTGNHHTAARLADLLADHGDPDLDTKTILSLDPSGRSLARRGPPRLKRIRPSRGSSRSHPSKWDHDPAMGRVEFVDGNPDHIRIRGIHLRSGDIGVVGLNHPGDGIFDSFLTRPGVAPHAMLYLSRRVRITGDQTLIQPSLLEIYEGGWRTVPITTALHPKFSWYSQWIRPTTSHGDLPDDIGNRLSDQLDELEPLSFDFQSRRIPPGGRFDADWGPPSASCTNLIRIPFERLGITLPYPTTPIHPGAVANLDRLGLPGIGPIHTPTNILADSGFRTIGVIDNARPELAYAQSMVVGRPHLPHTFGGHFCARELQIENLPNWKSIHRWQSAYAAMLIQLGQSKTKFADLSRLIAGYTPAEIPKTASPTTIAFYLRSDFEAGHIVHQIAHHLFHWFQTPTQTKHLPTLQTHPHFTQQIQTALNQTALQKEHWYKNPIPHPS